MASAHASNYPHDDLRDDESILDDDVIEADDGKLNSLWSCIVVLRVLTHLCDSDRSR